MRSQVSCNRTLSLGGTGGPCRMARRGMVRSEVLLAGALPGSWLLIRQHFGILTITTALDTFDKVDCEKAARAVDGIRRVVEMLANEESVKKP